MRGFLKLIVFVAVLYYGYGYLVSQGYIDAASTKANAAFNQPGSEVSDQSKTPQKAEPHEAEHAYYITAKDIDFVNKRIEASMQRYGATPPSVITTPSGVSIRFDVEKRKTGICPKTKRPNYSVSMKIKKPMILVH